MIKETRDAVVGKVNDSKILKMHHAGSGTNTIVGAFKDDNINVTPNYVKGVIEMEGSNYYKKFISNKTVKGTIEGQKSAGDDPSIIYV